MDGLTSPMGRAGSVCGAGGGEIGNMHALGTCAWRHGGAHTRLQPCPANQAAISAGSHGVATGSTAARSAERATSVAVRAPGARKGGVLRMSACWVRCCGGEWDS